MKYKNYIVFNGGEEFFGASFLPEGAVFEWDGTKYVARDPASNKRYEVSYEMITDPRMSEYVRETE